MKRLFERLLRADLRAHIHHRADKFNQLSGLVPHCARGDFQMFDGAIGHRQAMDESKIFAFYRCGI